LYKQAGKGWIGMARSTADEIRRRIAKRKKGKETPENGHERRIIWPGDDEKYGFPSYSSSDTGFKDDGHPLFKKEVFFFKILASVLLFLAVAILFRNHSATFAPARDFVTKSMDNDFKFAVVSKWYEDKFGKPLALLPFSKDDQADKTQAVQTEYAVPAMGKILENFQKNGQGIMIETQKGTAVQVIKDGFVRFAGVKEGLGKTVIVQHSDQSETWYGNLAEIKVNLYEYIKNRTVVGTVSTSSDEDKTKGKFYFAIKKGDNFVDPSKVIRFE
jgi:stage IV sporulation protein FA